MEPQDIDALVNVTLAIGGLLVGIVSGIGILVWRVKGGLDKRDARLKAVETGLAAHEEECAEFREAVEKRFDDGAKHFTSIERSLGRIEGAIGVKADSAA